jgi:hypothetical protein
MHFAVIILHRISLKRKGILPDTQQVAMSSKNRTCYGFSRAEEQTA